MILLADPLWAGTHDSLLSVQRAEEAMLAYASSDKKPTDEGSLLTVVGNVGVIAIKGALVNADVPDDIASLFGVTTYPGIQRALVRAAQDSKVANILLDVNSGGGAVSGLPETSDLMEKVGKVKPIHTYSGNSMASGAYWLGVHGQTITGSRAGVVGSIGVIRVHTEYSKQLEQDGIKATVFRAGRFKALGQPVEALTPEAEAQIQAHLDHVYSVFVEHVSTKRGVPYTEADQGMAQGQEFFGIGAVRAGLIDELGTFEDVLSRLQQEGKSAATPQRSLTMQSRASLTEAQLAALQEGAGGLDAAASVENEPANVDAGAQENTGAESDQGGDEAPAAAAAEAAAAKPDEGVVAYLREELVRTNEKVIQLSTEMNVLRASQSALAAVQVPMQEIVQASVARMRVALGMPAVDVSKLSGEALLAEHKSLSEQFSAQFKSGGVAAVAPTAEQAETPATPVAKAAIRSVRFPASQGRNK